MKRGLVVLIVAFVISIGSSPSRAAVDTSKLAAHAASLVRPLLVTAPPGDADRLFIVEQDGVIRIFKDGAVLDAPFLDVSELTRSPADGGDVMEGLLGLAFHPDYDMNHYFFVYHTDSTGTNDMVVRYTCDPADPDRADATSRTVLLMIPHVPNENGDTGLRAFGAGPAHGGGWAWEIPETAAGGPVAAGSP